MNNLIPFEYSGNEVRVVTIDDEPWWVAKDVCVILGLTDTNKALIALDDDEKCEHEQFSGSGRKPMLVNEPGLYSLILRSRKPEAKQFKRWVTHEVIPSIRKTGGYQMPSYPEALRIAADTLEKLEQAKPAIDFYKAVTDSKDAIPMAQVAKVLDMGIGRNKLFAFLRENGVLRSNNEPYQEYIDKGWFRVVEQKFTTPDGETRINIKTLVYQKGMNGINRMLKEKRGAA